MPGAVVIGLVLLCANCTPAPAGPAHVPGPLASAGSPYETLALRYVRATADGKNVEVGRFERGLAEYGDKPISLVVRQTSGEQDDGPARFEARFEMGEERQSFAPFDLDCAKPSSCITKEWLELELRGRGVEPRQVVRDLFVKTDEQPRAPGYRRYTVVAVPGELKTMEVQRRARMTLPGLKLEERKATAEAIEAEEVQGDEAVAAAKKATRIDALDAGGHIGQLIALGFAAESDEATARLARKTGVTVQRRVPRILITSAEATGEEGTLQMSLDLRLDEVGASADPAKQAAFQVARGMQESALEGAYLARVTGQDTAVSTAALMHAAASNSVPLLSLTGKTRSRLEQLGLPPHVHALADAALRRNHRLIIPSQAVDLAGKSRWGFWDIDPLTGVTIGVMESGQHQAMVDVSLATSKAGLNPKMFFFLGMEVGVITSAWMISSLVIQYGEMTPEAVQELIDMIRGIACSSCPTVREGKVEPMSAKDCAEKIKDMASSAGDVDAEPENFCEMYQDGMMCGLGLVLLALPDPPPKEDEEGDGEETDTYTVVCTEVDVPKTE